MKKLLYLFAAAAIMSLSSCNNPENDAKGLVEKQYELIKQQRELSIKGLQTEIKYASDKKEAKAFSRAMERAEKEYRKKDKAESRKFEREMKKLYKELAKAEKKRSRRDSDNAFEDDVEEVAEAAIVDDSVAYDYYY